MGFARRPVAAVWQIANLRQGHRTVCSVAGRGYADRPISLVLKSQDRRYGLGPPPGTKKKCKAYSVILDRRFAGGKPVIGAVRPR
jgi:hypothetical protein